METQHAQKVALQKQILSNTKTTLKSMELTRLELIPVVLEAVEQVKTGEITPREFDNACGRARVRLQRLREMHNEVESLLESMEVTSTVSESAKIEMKRNSLMGFLNKSSKGLTK